MNESEIIEFKTLLDEFHTGLLKEIKNDSDYDGEANELLDTVKRLQKEFKTIHTKKEFEASLSKIADDFTFFMGALEVMNDEMGEYDDLDDEDDFEDDEDFEYEVDIEEADESK